MGDVIAQAEAHAAARAGVDEVIHGAGVEGVLAVHEGGQQVHIALLGAAQGDEVGQPLPGLEVPGADDACGGHGGGQVGVRLVLALGAEHTVDPAVLVFGQPHIIDVGLVGAGVGQLDGLVPEAEAVHRGAALGHRKKALAVVALHPGCQVEPAIQLDGAGVEHGVDPQPLHKIGVCGGVEVEPPLQGDVLAGEDRVLPPVIDAVVKIALAVFAGQQGLLQGLLAQVFGVQLTLRHGGPS